MAYKNRIDVELPKQELKLLYEAIKPELEESRFKRSKIKLTYGNDALSFMITADDATALSASVNAVIKLLAVYEKALRLVDNNAG